MTDQKYSLDDILTEYKSDPDDGRNHHVRRTEAQKIINSTIPDPIRAKASVPQPKAVSHERNELFDKREDLPVIADEPDPTKLSRKKVAVASADGISEMRETAARGNSPEPVFIPDGTPMIRRMADSTRARESERSKKKRKKERRTYTKESPVGEYMYTPPEFKQKKRTRSEILRDAESPEGRRYITDIVPSPAAEAAARPVEPAPRAELTSIDLGQNPQLDANAIDVHITQDSEEYTRAQSRSKRTKRIVDFNYYGDVQDVGRDIYELKEILSTRVTVLAMTAFLSLYITLCSQFDLPILSFLSIGSINTYLLAHLVLGLLSVFYSMPVITKGFKNLFSLKADSDSMTAVTAVACLISILTAFLKTDLAQKEVIHIYMPVGIIALLFNAIGKLLIIRRAKRNFTFISRNFDRHAVVYVKDEERAERLARGTSGDFPIMAAMRKTDFLTDFLRYSYSADITDSFCRRLSPIWLSASLIITVFLTLFRTGSLFSAYALSFGFSIFSMLICAGCCVAMPFVANIPLERISGQTLKNKGILLGWQSVDDLYDTNSILVEAGKLFPEGSVKLGGIKVFSNTKLDEALLDAASLTYHAGSVMQLLFSDVIVGKEELLYKIENYSYEEDLGLCGWINNRRVLLGNRELMESHNIEGIPTKSKETEYAQGHEPIYLSISGNLAAMFVADITADRGVKKWSQKMSKKKICMIVKTVDPFITQQQIAAVYGLPQNLIKVIPKKLHEDFNAETKKTIRQSASMACTGRFSSMAQLILGIKIIHSSAIVGLIVQAVSILLGFGLAMMLILSKAFEFNYIYMSATAMVIYQLICTLLTCLAVSRRKI